MMEILHRTTGAVIYSGDYETTKEMVVCANGSGIDLSVADLRESDLSGADLRESDLSESDLRRSNLRGADLRGADLRESDLSGASLTMAYMRSVILPEGIPTVSSIHIAVRDAIAEKGNHLDMSVWHTCETTHCRAGWVIVLAGEAGYELEAALGTNVAAALIYQASDPELERTPNWTATDESAMADIEYMAEAQQQQRGE